MKDGIAIHWFRKDLRVSDNPSLNYLSKNHNRIVGLYIFDEVSHQRKWERQVKFGYIIHLDI